MGLLKFDAFNDIEFNPEKSFNCQARSCALYVSLLETGLLHDALADPVSFVEVLEHHGYGVDFTQGELSESAGLGDDFSKIAIPSS